eukprot:CAMPEP_0167769070 /NCGR_PEP_ID=MMETSP0110_2-20121227/17078_1 /TAXON_ID=629695 /ORGANISM="Gymnochlora sp., Strain CCMP2014" /LENGTH=124 /DNA_ID=CAMNT_0007657933 /DNA_START=601 /DNA_END=975 /DNA_ORIENTATION=-
MATRLYHTSPSQRKMLVLPDTSDHNTFNLYSDILRPVASFIRTHCRASAREVGWAKLIASKSSEREKQKLDAKAFGAFELESVKLNLPKFLKDVPFYAWEKHKEFKTIMTRLMTNYCKPSDCET